MDSSDPIDPLDPFHPLDPLDPLDPSDPTDPLDPSDPSDPTPLSVTPPLSHVDLGRRAAAKKRKITVLTVRLDRLLKSLLLGLQLKGRAVKGQLYCLMSWEGVCDACAC